jgi:O-antigen/teichoic acid export membrane protein
MNSKNQPTNMVKSALFSGVLNALINGIINWFQVKGKTELFLTVDAITNTEHTVLGGAVMLAASLAAILTIIGYFTVKSPDKPPFYPKALLLTLKNTFFAFGVMVTVSILIQRIAGSIAVTPFTGVVIVGLVAGVVAGVVDYMTKKELLTQS